MSSQLPPLAGLCTYEDAQRTGLSVDETVGWMKRHHYVLLRLHEIFTARITAEPIYELKTAFSLHAYVCAEHVSSIRQRVSELREPPHGLEEVPHHALKFLCDEVLGSPGHTELVLGIYGIIVPELIESVKSFISTTNPLADAPSIRIARFCLIELEDLQRFGDSALAALVNDSMTTELEGWRSLLIEAVRQSDGISGKKGSSLGMKPIPLTPRYSSIEYRYDSTPRRDARFQDPYNAGVNPEAFLYDDRFEARDKVLMMFYKRLRELDVPEMMSSIISETRGKPWKYYRDMSRQLWDEARHSMLGEVGFVQQGIDWTQIPINFTWSKNLNTQLEPWQRHAVLFFIEQGLMPKTGKRFEWEIAKQSGIPLAELIQDFDWADEVLHAQIGREWYVKEFSDLREAMDYGDRCWSQVMSHWNEYREKGLTEHRNWWPDLYRQACERWGITPDPDALNFQTTYETVRADLKNISTSG